MRNQHGVTTTLGKLYGVLELPGDRLAIVMVIKKHIATDKRHAPGLGGFARDSLSGGAAVEVVQVG